MASPIDPPRTPLAPAARALAEAALQRQNMLLRPAGATPAATPAEASFPATLQPSAVPPQFIAPPPLPQPATPDRVSLSPQARESLQGTPGGDAPGRTGSAAGGSDGRPAQAPLASLGRPATAATDAAAPLRTTPWPTGGVPAPLRQVLDALVRQLTAPGQAPQRVVAAQPWSAALEAQLAAHEDSGLPPLRTWLVGQGAVQTGEGARPVAVALRVPAAWLQEQPPSAAGTHAAGPLSAAFAGRPQALASGLFALVLQSPEADGARTSALLALDVTPWLAAQAATVYGRDPRSAGDPWLQMAALQAAGWRPPDEDEDTRGGHGTPCDTPGCPYLGQATCVQPFCMALRVAPMDEAQRLGERLPPPPLHNDKPPGPG